MNNNMDVLNDEQSIRRFKVWAEINLGALERNYKKIEKLVWEKNANAAVIPVIKADAYGHGAVHFMNALFKCGAGTFAVSAVSEAVELAKSLPGVNVLILGYTVPEDVDLLLKYNLIQTVYSLDYAKELAREAERLGGVLRVHIKLDSGMNRLGFDTSDTETALAEIKEVLSSPHIKLEGVLSHFACADILSSDMTFAQMERFEKTLSVLEDAGIDCGTRHICNSAGILRADVPVYDAVRAGIILYGLMPSEDFSGYDFETVMTLKARVAHVHEIEIGETVGYGAEFVADRKMKIATLPIGYADGFIRAYRNSDVIVGGKSCKLVGRICMDQCMVDITDVPVPVKPGDEVIIFNSRERVEKLARLAKTNVYEVCCFIGKRVPRVCINK